MNDNQREVNTTMYLLLTVVLCCFTLPAHSNASTCDPPCVTGQGECVVLQNSLLASHLEDKAYCNCSAADDGFYYGNQCQHLFTAICHLPCQNGGKCDTGVCKCTKSSTGSWFGSDCSQFWENNCDTTCLNGGTCRGSYCSCVRTADGSYTGSSCADYISSNTCDPPCINGDCSYNRCNCWRNSTVRYSGSTCENEFFPHAAPCSPECENGGTCNRGSCTCALNSTHYFSGSSCEIVNEGCPCRNGGTCDNNDDMCRCRGNETHILLGRNCDYPSLKYCYPSPLNGGICPSNRYKCPYDDVGYFHGKQCLEYDYRNKSCLAPKVYDGRRCTCPYSLSERFVYEGLDCEHRVDF